MLTDMIVLITSTTCHGVTNGDLCIAAKENHIGLFLIPMFSKIKDELNN